MHYIGKRSVDMNKGQMKLDFQLCIYTFYILVDCEFSIIFNQLNNYGNVNC